MGSSEKGPGGAAPDVTVVIPAYNEEEGLLKIFPSLSEVALRENLGILVVDDGSSDGGLSGIGDFPGVRVVRHGVNRGYGASVRTGVESCNTPYALIMDADGQHDPADIPRLLALKGRCDMVVGARTPMPPESPVKRAGRAVLGLIVSRACGRAIPDFNSGFRLLRRETFLRYAGLYPDGFSISTTMVIAFLRGGHDVRFIPISVRPRRGGPSKVSLWRDGAATFLLILRAARLLSTPVETTPDRGGRE